MANIRERIVRAKSCNETLSVKYSCRASAGKQYWVVGVVGVAFSVFIVYKNKKSVSGCCSNYCCRNKCIALRLYDTFTDILLVYVFAGYKSSSSLNGANVRLFLKLAKFLDVFCFFSVIIFIII